MASTVRVLIVDDDAFTRVLLSSYVQGIGYDVAAACATAKAALAASREGKPHIAVLDLDLGPGPTGIDLAQGLRRMDPEIALVMLTSYDDPRLLRIRDLDLPAGTVYLPKAAVTSRADIAEAMERALVEPPSKPRRKNRSDGSAISRLSDGQIDVMRLVAAGLSNAKIGEELFITEAAVGKAVARLIRQLGITANRDQNQRVLIAQTYYEAIGPVAGGRE